MTKFQQVLYVTSLNLQSEVEALSVDSVIWQSVWGLLMNGMIIKKRHRKNLQLNGVKRMDSTMSDSNSLVNETENADKVPINGLSAQ